MEQLTSKNLSWQLLLSVGLVLWIGGKWFLVGTIVGAWGTILGVFLIAVGLVRLIFSFVKSK